MEPAGMIQKWFCPSEQESSVIVSRIGKDFTVCNDALRTPKAVLYCMVVDVRFQAKRSSQKLKSRIEAHQFNCHNCQETTDSLSNMT